MDTLRLLCVDDEASMRSGVSRALRDFTVDMPEFDRSVRFELATAASGEEALEHIAAQEVDLVLLDYKMPGITGLEVMERLATENRDLVIIMVTAFASIETAVAATKQGAFDFLAKPFTPKELKSVVEKATHHLLVQRHARELEAEKHRHRFQLISVVAHELKSPLAVLESFLEVLKDPAVREDEEKVAHFLGRGVYRLQGMRRLITDLLDLTRIESGVKQRELHQVDLIAIAHASLEGARTLAADRGIEVAVDMPAALPMVGNEGELEIILNNLLSNAVKYNRDGGRVELAVTTQEGRVRIRVADTGIGMSPEESAKLFGEFVRIKNRKTKNILGSGLGLSIVRKLARLYGGDATVASVPDEGSTFTVELLQHHDPEGE